MPARPSVVPTALKVFSPSARLSAKTDRSSTEGTLHVIMVIPLQFRGGQREIVRGAKRAWRRCEQDEKVQFLRAANASNHQIQRGVGRGVARYHRDGGCRGEYFCFGEPPRGNKSFAR